ncbi:MAG: hypothetical protein ACOYOA_11615 [Saprospiraceae bacterium]
MQVTVELLNEHALNLLQELEHMKVIRFLNPDKNSTANPLPFSKSKFAGRLSKESAEKMHLQLNEMRGEWEKKSI